MLVLTGAWLGLSGSKPQASSASGRTAEARAPDPVRAPPPDSKDSAGHVALGPSSTGSATAAGAAESASASGSRAIVHVSANEQVSFVRVGKRTMIPAIPAKELDIELLPDEATAASEVVVKSVDGRFARGTLEPGETSLALKFTPSSGAKGPPSLARNPYDKKTHK